MVLQILRLGIMIGTASRGGVDSRAFSVIETEEFTWPLVMYSNEHYVDLTRAMNKDFKRYQLQYETLKNITCN
ncbi:hypothetical protein llap_4957 [Limosa lapponica baueri]|uniref:Uncharacterized protein n=1 Tax=Limosa lapponica baueri TaxID=1758121 RepID=A0A2I0UFC4_LIMLA|nr:hypothetical protein llap_4957 [Limosa lapponica baueri]